MSTMKITLISLNHEIMALKTHICKENYRLNFIYVKIIMIKLPTKSNGKNRSGGGITDYIYKRPYR